jgi:hypothetical protein
MYGLHSLGLLFTSARTKNPYGCTEDFVGALGAKWRLFLTYVISH